MIAKKKEKEPCSYCGSDCEGDPFEFDRDNPYCSEACFEADQEGE